MSCVIYNQDMLISVEINMYTKFTQNIYINTIYNCPSDQR